MFDEDELFRWTVVMARHAFGEGRYRYFADPLPPLVQALRTQLYPPMARIANTWAERLDERSFPDTLDGLLAECAAVGQTKPTPLVLRYGPTGYNCLHQDVYGELTFPLQFLDHAEPSPTRTSPAARACSSSSGRASSPGPWSRARARARP